MKIYKVEAPVGSNLAPEGPVGESQLREFAIQVNQSEEYRDTWVEKITKDGIEEVVEWLKGAGFEVEEVEQ